jgi:hypothetical protein
MTQQSLNCLNVFALVDKKGREAVTEVDVIGHAPLRSVRPTLVCPSDLAASPTPKLPCGYYEPLYR